jgi:hypothetical protein
MSEEDTRAEILPAGSDGIEPGERRSWNAGQGESVTETFSSDRKGALDLYNELRDAAEYTPGLAGLDFSVQRGRGNLSVTYVRTLVSAGIPSDDTGVQELLGVGIRRGIYLAPYFDELTTEQIAEVRLAYENQEKFAGLFINAAWNDKQKHLAGHLYHGADSYEETAYVFRQTRRAAWNELLLTEAGNPNTVQPLPALSPELQRHIDALPGGEWLKKPVQTRFLGRQGTDVVTEYQWAPKWSIVYGGTFTGI